MKITKEMVIELNNELANRGCSFRFEYGGEEFGKNPNINIIPCSMVYIDSYIINPTQEFFDWLELWFKLKGITLGFNNTRSIVWSMDGWSD